MRITFSCPGCTKPYDLPLSYAGKKGRCKKCQTDFVIPAPIEHGPPRSSEAIPVVAVLEPSPPKASTASPPRANPPVVHSKPVEPARSRPPVEPEVDSDDDDWPEYALATPEPKPEPPVAREPEPEPLPGPSRSSAAAGRSESSGSKKKETKASQGPRPAWFIPAVIGGSSAVVFLVNFVAFLAISSGLRTNQPVEVAQNGPVATPEPARNVEAPAKVEPRPAAKPETIASRPVPPRPAVEAAPPVEVIPDRPMSSADIAARYEPSIALIKGRKGTGTGFIVKPGLLATNAHVIDGERARDLEIRFPSADKARKGPLSAKIVYQDRDRDLAILAVTTNLPPVRIAEGYKFIKGEDVTVIGNPGVGGQMILENAISRGLVSSMAKINDHSFIQLSIAINPGNSGGPVFDSKGRVIGVVTLKTTKQEGLAFAVPVEDVVRAFEVAESMTSNDGGAAKDDGGVAKNDAGAAKPGPADVPRAERDLPQLAYAWKQGQSYVYSFGLTLETGDGTIGINGSSIYRVKSVDGDGMTLGHKGWYVQTKRSKDGQIVPGSIGAPTETQETEIKIDPQGEILAASGSATLPLLGDFSMLLIEPLPDDPVRTWNDSRTITLNEVEQGAGGGGGVPRLGRPGAGGSLRSRSAQRRGGARPAPSAPSVKVTSHEATEETVYVLGEKKGDLTSIRKQYELTTKEMVGDEPRLRMTGQGTIAFDLKAGVPTSLDYSLKVVENSVNATVRLPITVKCKLLEGKEREVALQPPVYNPTAMNEVENADINRFVSTVKSNDQQRRREVFKVLYDAAPLENRRSDVSRALEPFLKDEDWGVRSEVVKALGIWGDEKTVKILLDILPDPKYTAREELFEAIAKLAPTVETVEAFFPYLEKDFDRAKKAMRAIGPASEGPLLRVAESGENLITRTRTIQILKELGTSVSVPVLQKIAKGRESGEIGRAAEESIRNIKNRFPSQQEMTSLIEQLSSPDGRKRSEAAGKLSRCILQREFQAEVCRGLEGLLDDVDRDTQGLAMLALGTWGTPASRPAIIAMLQDPAYRSRREAIQTLAKLGPDEASARAIASEIKKDSRTVVESLGKMGPVAEAAVIDALPLVEKQVFARNDLFKLLGKIGGPSSLPVLRAATEEKRNRDAQEALKQLEERLNADPATSLNSCLRGLKSGDGGVRRESLEKLVDLKPSDQDRAKVSRALEPIWELNDNGTARQLREVVVLWADARTADFLVKYLSNPDAKLWDEAMKALAEIRPDAKAGELLAARYQKNLRLVIELAPKFPPGPLDPPLLESIKTAQDTRFKVDACRAIGLVGSSAAIPELEALAKHGGDGELAAHAEDALRNIAARQ